MNEGQTKDQLLTEGRALKDEVKALKQEKKDDRALYDRAQLELADLRQALQATKDELVGLKAADVRAPYQRGCPKGHDMPQTGSVYVMEGFVFCNEGHHRAYAKEVFGS